MLREMRENSRSAIIYVLFGILIAAFVISFGPQRGNGTCSTVASTYAAKVKGRAISEGDWRYAYLGNNYHRIKANDLKSYRLKDELMDRLIEREILVRQGEKMGFRVSTAEA